MIRAYVNVIAVDGQDNEDPSSEGTMLIVSNDAPIRRHVRDRVTLKVCGRRVEVVLDDVLDALQRCRPRTRPDAEGSAP